jgi:hypothetical protein
MMKPVFSLMTAIMTALGMILPAFMLADSELNSVFWTLLVSSALAAGLIWPALKSWWRQAHAPKM